MTKESFETWEKKLLTMDPEAAKKTIDAAMPVKLRSGASPKELGEWFDREKNKPWCALYNQENLARHKADYWVVPQWSKRKYNPHLWSAYPWKYAGTELIRSGGDKGIIIPDRQIHDEIVNMI